MCKRDAPPRDGLSQDRSRRRSTLSNYSNKRLTKTDMVVECLEATPHEAVTLPALHSYLQENIARLTATSLTWVHDIKAACDLELAKPTSRIAELPVRQPGGPLAYKLHLQHVLRSATAPTLEEPPRAYAEAQARAAAKAAKHLGQSCKPCGLQPQATTRDGRGPEPLAEVQAPRRGIRRTSCGGRGPPQRHQAQRGLPALLLRTAPAPARRLDRRS